MNEFPLATVLLVVSVVRHSRISCVRSPFVSGDIESVTSERKHIVTHSVPPYTQPLPLVLRSSGSRAVALTTLRLRLSK